MHWEELTAPDFAKAVDRSEGVCLLPLGCMEKHGDHLPLGTDLLQIRAIASAAAAQEPVVVYPPYFYSQITCARHQPGTIAITEPLLFDLLEATCCEIARNGLRKIVLLNGHGGNFYFLHYFAWMMVHSRDHDFVPYLARLQDFWTPDHTATYEAMKETEHDGHGGERETSTLLAIRPELVKMDDLAAEPGLPRKRTAHLPLYTPIWWYADYPDHYSGDGHPGTAEKGRALIDDCAAAVAEILRAVKADDTARALIREFRTRAQNPRANH